MCINNDYDNHINSNKNCIVDKGAEEGGQDSKLQNIHNKYRQYNRIKTTIDSRNYNNNNNDSSCRYNSIEQKIRKQITKT